MNTMKRIATALSLSFLICPLAISMQEAKKEKSVKTSTLKTIKEYIKVNGCFLALAGIFADDDESGDEESEAPEEGVISQDQEAARRAVNVIIDHIRFDNFNLTIGGKKEKAKKYIDAKKLQKFLTTVNNDYFDPKAEINAERKLAYVKMLRDSLKMKALETDLNTTDFCDLKNLFDEMIAYYEGKSVKPIEEIVKLEKIFSLLGINVEKYGKINNIKRLINMLLQKQSLSKPFFLDCLNLTALITLFDVDADEETMREYELCVNSMISMAIDVARDQQKAFKKIRKMIAFYDAFEKATIADLEVSQVAGNVDKKDEAK